MKTTEQNILEIQKIFLDEWHYWTEVSILSMIENQEAYIAKVLYMDTDDGQMRDIWFRAYCASEKIRRSDGKIVDEIQADAEGKTIAEAVSNLLRLTTDFTQANYLAEPAGKSPIV